MLANVFSSAPWNVGVFFVLYAAFFIMLVQPAFGVSVAGQVCMGTVFVLTRQAMQECYLGLSHGHLPLYRKLQFLGSVRHRRSAVTAMRTRPFLKRGNRSTFFEP